MSTFFNRFTLVTLLVILMWSIGGADRIVIDVDDPGELSVTTDNFGDHVELEGYVTGALPGEPELPWKEFCTLLPEDTIWETIEVSLEDAVWEDVIGTYDIAPAPPAVTMKDMQQIVEWTKDPARIVNGRDIAVYETNAYIPAKPVDDLVGSQYREWYLGYVTVHPLLYNPVLKSLRILRSGSILITFDRNPPGPAALAAAAAVQVPGREYFFNKIKDKVINTGDGDDFYPAHALAQSQSDPKAAQAFRPGFYIMTVPGVYDILEPEPDPETLSKMLFPFMDHKVEMGYDVRLAVFYKLEGEDIDYRIEQRMRPSIRNAYHNGVEHVLIIGSPDPSQLNEDKSLPMKMCYPNPLDHSAEGAVPTDLYFAELSGFWDYDGDGFYGEYGDRVGGAREEDFHFPGGIDRDFEVSLGRIPYYNKSSDKFNELEVLDGILEKMMNYETSVDDVSWRKKLLIPAAIVNFPNQDNFPFGSIDYVSATWGSFWGENMKKMAPTNWKTFTLYEQSGIPEGIPPHIPDAPINYFYSEWMNMYGYVGWFAHGSQPWWVWRMIWANDFYMMDGMPQEPSFEVDWVDWGPIYGPDDGHPSFVAMASCEIGWPEEANKPEKDGIGCTLLRDGAIGTFSCSRVSFYTPRSWSPNIGYANGDCPAYPYLIFDKMMNDNYTAGHAINWCKSNVGMGMGYASWWNSLTFNYYGDPSLNHNLDGFLRSYDFVVDGYPGWTWHTYDTEELNPAEGFFSQMPNSSDWALAMRSWDTEADSNPRFEDDKYIDPVPPYLAYGYWQSPRETVEDRIPYEPDKLYMVKWQLVAGHDSAEYQPGLRFRIMSGSDSCGGDMVIQEFAGYKPLISANANNPTQIVHYWYPPQWVVDSNVALYPEQAGYYLAAEMFDNRAAAVGTYWIPRVDVVTTSTQEAEITTLFEAPPFDKPAWRDTTKQGDVYTYLDETLGPVISFSESSGSDMRLSFWEMFQPSTTDTILLEADKVYRLTYTLHSSVSQLPVFRQRMQTRVPCLGSENTFTPTTPLGGVFDYAIPGPVEREMMCYLAVGNEFLSGDSLLFSMDVYGPVVGTDPYCGQYRLTSVKVEALDDPWK